MGCRLDLVWSSDLENSATSIRDVAKLGAPWALHASSAKLREALHLSFSNGLGTIYDFT
jgi:hypothetical protein